MQMISYDFLRTLVLNSPNKICEDCSLYEYYIHELINNPKFEILVAAILFFCILMAFIVYFRAPGDDQSWYLIYFIGTQIFIIALEFKISLMGFKTEISEIDQSIYNALKRSVDKSYSSSLSFLSTLSTKLHSNTMFPSRSYNTNISQLLDYDALEDEIAAKLEKGGIVLLRHPSGDGGASEISDKKSMLSKKTLVVDANDSSASKKLLDRADDHPPSDGKVKSTIIEKITVTEDPPKIAENNSNTGSNGNKKPETHKNIGNGKSRSSNNNLAGTQNTQHRNADDNSYFDDVMNAFREEFDTNSKFAVDFKRTTDTLDRIEDGLSGFDVAFKKLIFKCSEISDELRVLGVSVSRLEHNRVGIFSALEKIIKMKEVMPNLNYEKSSDKQLNQMLNTKFEDAPHNSNENVQEKKIITCLEVLLIIEGAFCVLFLVQIFRSSGTYTIRLFLAAITASNMIISITVMGLAHFYDKKCMHGGIGSCGDIYESGFANFAKFADLNLNTRETSKVGDFEKSLNKIEYRTGRVVSTIQPILEDEAIGEFRMQSAQLVNTLEKLDFAKESFTDIVGKKVEKSDFYNLVDDVRIRNAQTSQDLSSLSKKELLDFYVKEVGFKNYINSQKPKIMSNSQKQLLNPSKGEDKRTKECDSAWREVCEKTIRLDQLSLLLLTSSLIFMIGLAIL